MTIPLLMTTYIQVDESSNVQLKSYKARLHHTIESIRHWLEIDSKIQMVICDGSNFDFRPIILQEFPSAEIECLFFQNDSLLVKQYGKGFGEGQIINFALENSTYLQHSSSFIKCTGKLWVKNFPECLLKFNGNFIAKAYFSNIFSLNKTMFEYVDTRFFICSKKFYELYIKASYERSKGYSIEHCLRDTIISNQLQNVLINTPVIVEGTSGELGTYYKNNMKRFLKEKLRLFLLKRGKYQSLFIQ